MLFSSGIVQLWRIQDPDTEGLNTTLYIIPDQPMKKYPLPSIQSSNWHQMKMKPKAVSTKSSKLCHSINLQKSTLLPWIPSKYCKTQKLATQIPPLPFRVMQNRRITVLVGLVYAKGKSEGIPLVMVKTINCVNQAGKVTFALNVNL